jgi:Holliday junction resolvase RusA-like endonuclease
MIATQPMLLSPHHTAITFDVGAEPKGQPRPRAFARKFGDKWQAQVYDAGTAEGFKSAVALAARPHLPADPIAGAVSLSLTFRMPRPKGHYRTGRNSHVLRETAPFYHTGRPDADNLVKAVTDSLTQLGMWRDDSQVCMVRVFKRYAESGERPGVLVSITELEAA